MTARSTRYLAALTLSALLALPGLADTTDIQAGEKVFQQCKGCHQIGSGATHRSGPHLNALFGRKAAGLDDFRYSKSFQRAGASGLEWHADTLDVFLEDPRAMTSGTRMSFRGIKNAADRTNPIAFLRQYSDNPANIPEADPTAIGIDHDVDPAILALVGDPEYGEYLSGECTTCHQATGGDDGIPSITLWPEDQFVVAMHAYKTKKRNHPVMQMIAGRLGDDEIAALAAYFKDLEN